MRRKHLSFAAGLFASIVLALLLACPAYAAFTDVPASHWAAGDIQYVAERGLFKGTSATTFGPNANMDRAMLATVLYRYAGSPPVSGSTPYADVAAGQWYTAAVTWAYQNGIFPQQVLNSRMLSPSSNVRRAEFSIMLYNFAKTLNKADCDTNAMGQHPFTDMEWNNFSFSGFGPIYNEAVEAMLGWARPNGIITGTSSTTLNPLGTITRAEVAAMLSRFDKNVLGGTDATVQLKPAPEPTPDTDKYAGYTLANGKPITEENVYEILMGLKETYPTGSLYGAPYVSTSSARGPFGNRDHCAGWAWLCSDAAFGNLPWRKVTNPNWDEIKVGDLIAFDTETSGHVVVVLEKGFVDITVNGVHIVGDYIDITDSGNHNKVHWGGTYFREDVEKFPGLTLYTRYPV